MLVILACDACDVVCNSQLCRETRGGKAGAILVNNEPSETTLQCVVAVYLHFIKCICANVFPQIQYTGEIEAWAILANNTPSETTMP